MAVLIEVDINDVILGAGVSKGMESDIDISGLMFVESCPPKRNNIGNVGCFVSF